jgi:polyisoprenoid-binding protein YceI
MRTRFVTLLASAAIIATSACALAFNAPSTKLDTAQSGIYEIDPTHTSVLFGISHMGFSSYHGRFNSVSGTLDFNATVPEKSALSVTIPIESIDTNHRELEGKLKGADWFDAAQFPTATFTSTRIEKLSETTGKITGNLTLHGVTQPLTLDVTFNGAGENPFAKSPMLGFSAKGSIKRSDFGLGKYAPGVSDETELSIAVEALKN